MHHPVFADGETQALALLIHLDGCGMFNETEVHIWSFRSPLAADETRPWAHKNFVVAVPEEAIPNEHMRQQVEQEVLRFIGWSMAQVTLPTHGFYGERLQVARAEKAGTQ